MCSLISTLYAFDHDKFNLYWRQQLIYRKIISNTWNVPQKTKHFVGRRELLNTIKIRMAEQYDTNKPLILTAACTGMGGVGKTQLALQFIHLHGHEYSQIYWIDAESEDSIMNSYIKLGESKGLFGPPKDRFVNPSERLSREDKICIVKNWLENVSPKGWLLIYDNADNYETIKKLSPTQSGKILITSRHTEWENRISVDVFSKAEALEYIQVIIGQEVIDDAKTRKDAKALIKLLQRLPLALAHACAYIKHNNITIADYLALDKIQLLSQRLETIQEKYNPVTLTWDITLERMKQESPAAVELLYCCAYFHHNAIPEYLVQALFKEENLALQEIKTSNAIRVANEYSMIRVDNEKCCLSLHVLVQEVIKMQLKQDEETIYYASISLELLLDAYPDNQNTKENMDSQLKMKFFPHLKIMLNTIDENAKKSKSDFPGFMSNVLYGEISVKDSSTSSCLFRRC